MKSISVSWLPYSCSLRWASLHLLRIDTVISDVTAAPQGLIFADWASLLFFAIIVPTIKSARDPFFHTDMGSVFDALSSNEPRVKVQWSGFKVSAAGRHFSRRPCLYPPGSTRPRSSP